jgi:hypothetical protein
VSARGWVERLSRARASSATQQPSSRARQGAGSPARSGNPERIPAPPPGPRARPPVPDPKGSALRVVLVSRDKMLAGALRSLIEAPGGVRVLDWYSEELDAAIRHADVVIVDMPPNLHERTFAVIDGRFLGRTVVLLQEGEHAEALPPGLPRVILYRPVQIGELWMAVTGATPPASDPPAPGREGMPDAAPEPVDAGPVPPPEPQERQPPEPEPQKAEAPEPESSAAESEAVTADEAPTAEAAVGEAPAAEAAAEVDDQEPAPEEAVEATDGPAAVDSQGLPVAESGRLIGLSGQELDPVIGPGQVAPGMDEATLERLRGWGSQGREPAAGRAERAAADQATAAEAEGRREQSAGGQAARAAARAAAREEARQAKAARVAERQRARQARAAKAEARRVARKARAEEARQAKAAEAEARRLAREAKAEQVRREKAAKTEARAAARDEARRARMARTEARRAARAEARQARATRAEERRAARARSRQERETQAEARRAERAETRRAEAAAAEARRAERAEARRVGREEAGRERAARREESRQVRSAKAEARRATRAQAKQARAAWAEERRAARAEAAQQRAAGAGARGRVGSGVQTAVIILAVAAAGLAAAGWRGGGGPDTLAGEVAVVRAAGGGGGGLVVQDPRVGPIEPWHALAVGAWLRATEAGGSLEGAIREARVPGRFLLAGVVVLSVLVLLLLMRVGPGTGAAAGPGPAPPHTNGPDDPRRWWRLGAAAVAGALVALDPVLVRGGRTATGTVLAVVLALGALALAWGVPTRPALRWLPLVAAVGGLALLVSPLALPVLAVPVVAELLEGRHREAWRALAALGLGIGLWLALPIWVAGQGLDAGQAWWLLGRPPGSGAISASLADAPLTWLLVAAGLAAAILPWRHRSGARSDSRSAAARLLAWTATTAAGAVVAVALGYPADQALPFAVPAAAVALAAAGGSVKARRPAEEARRPGGVGPRLVGVAAGLALAGLLVAQGVDWGARYRPTADDGLARLVATVKDRVPGCSAVNAGGPDDRARLLAAGATVTGFSDGPAAQAAGVRYFVLTGATAQGGPQTPALAGWVRQHGTRLAVHPSRTLSGLELWQVDAPPLDPVADSLPVPDGVFSNVDGSACGGYRVVNSQVGSFYTAYQAVGGKAVLGRPLGSVWTSDGPALQAFDTMVLGAVPASSGPPAVAPIELPPLLAKLDVEAVADADIPLPSARPPVTDRQVQALLRDKMITRAYLGTDPATASAADRRRARARFGRPLGLPQVMPDGAVRQTFERVVLELPADGGPARPAALGRLAVRLGLVPKQAMRLEPVPGLPARPASTRLDTGPLLRLVGGALLLLALAAGAGAVTARRSRTTNSG